MKKKFPEMAADCFRFSCDELLIETNSEKWSKVSRKLEDVIETELPLLKDVVRIGAFKLMRYVKEK